MNDFLFNILAWIRSWVGSWGWAMVVFTVMIRLVLTPLDIKSRVSMRKTTKLQPQMQALQKKYANDKEKLNQKTAELYKKEHVNPLSSCLPLLLTWPILIAVFGATGWNAPNWMGRPVQWCGLDYAYALILLAKHDSTVDWRKIADGIVTSAECQLYTDEPGFEGLLPDSVQVKTQARYVFAINPTVVHMLRRMLDGKRTNVSVADANGRRIVAPYPMKVEGNGVKISAEKGVEYEIMIDGVEIVKIKSEGEDFYKP